MLAAMRQGATALVIKFVLFLIIVSFVVWGVGDVLRNTGHANVAKVGKHRISRAVFEQAWQREAENYRRVLGDAFTPALEKQLGLKQRLLQSMVQNLLLVQGANDLGLTVTDSMMGEALRSSDFLKDDQGKLNKELLKTQIARSGYTEKGYFNLLREDMVTSQLRENLTAAITPPEAVVDAYLRLEGEKREVALITMPENYKTGLADPSAETLQAYYTEHAESFTTPEYRQIVWVGLSLDQVSSSVQVSEEMLRTAYEERIESYRRPERRQVKQLIFATKEKAQEALIAAEKKSFEELANIFQAQNPKDVKLGDISKDALPDEVQDPVFALKEGEVSAPIETAAGWHIFKVEKILPSTVTPLAEVSKDLGKELKQTEIEETLYRQVASLEDALASGLGLEAAAKRLGFTVHVSAPFNREGLDRNGKKVELPAYANFLPTVYSLEEKTPSSVMTAQGVEDKNGGSEYFAVEVTNRIEPKVRSLEEAKSDILKAWRMEAEMKAREEKAAMLNKEFGEAKDAEAFARKNGLEISRATLSRRGSKDVAISEPMLNEIFTLPEGGSTQIWPAEGGKLAMARVGRILPADTKDKELASKLRQELADAYRSDVMGSYLAYLQKRYPVSIESVEAVDPQGE